MRNHGKSQAYRALCWVFVLLISEYSIQKSSLFIYCNELDEILCIERNSSKFESGICPSDRWFTTSMTLGGMGNTFEAYMNLWIWARDYPKEQVLQPHCLYMYLSAVCEELSVPVLRDTSCIPKKPVYILPDYDTNGERVARHFQALRHELQLKPNLRKKAQETLETEELKMTPPQGKTDVKKQAWWVSIHVRRSDYLWHIPVMMKTLNITSKIQYPPPMEWFVRAAAAHLQRAPVGTPRALMLLSDDTSWLLQELAPILRSQLGNSTHVAVLRATEVDALALLAAANSSIIDYGTFGMIGAILAGGNTTVYPLPLGISTHMNLIGHLPHWTVLNP